MMVYHPSHFPSRQYMYLVVVLNTYPLLHESEGEGVRKRKREKERETEGERDRVSPILLGN